MDSSAGLPVPGAAAGLPREARGKISAAPCLGFGEFALYLSPQSINPARNMEHHLRTSLEGKISLTTRFHEDTSLKRDKSLYKFIWVQRGTLDVDIDHVAVRLEEHEIVALTPLHHFEIGRVDGEYLAVAFNRNFYCIYGHDTNVSCNGLLFNGFSHIMRLRLSASQSERLSNIVGMFRDECGIKDSLQEETLRLLLKHFIITCTRIAREMFSVPPRHENTLDMIRQYYVLVDGHFKEKKQVQDYADMLHRSPKTISNLFSLYGLPSPLRVIHERIDAEAKRLLLYTDKSAKQIVEILGFDDLATFSRFFKKMNKENLSEYRKREKGQREERQSECRPR